MLWSLNYRVQQATIWTENVVSATAKLFYTLLALCFLNHGCHYHYRWCSILFWSLDSRPCMIKNKIYGTLQSVAAVVPAEPAVLPTLLVLSSNPTIVYFRYYASTTRLQSHGSFIILLAKPYMNILYLKRQRYLLLWRRLKRERMQHGAWLIHCSHVSLNTPSTLYSDSLTPIHTLTCVTQMAHVMATSQKPRSSSNELKCVKMPSLSTERTERVSFLTFPEYPFVCWRSGRMMHRKKMHPSHFLSQWEGWQRWTRHKC